MDQKSNLLLDFGAATEVKYTEIFNFKSSGTLKATDICLSPNEKISEDDEVHLSLKSRKSKELEVYKDSFIMNKEEAKAILEEKYGSNFIPVEDGEFKIQEWQAVKKIKHSGCFAVYPKDYGFFNAQPNKINGQGGIVAYVRKGNKLPSLDLIRAYQNALKNFCEDRSISERDDQTTFSWRTFHYIF